MSLRDSATKIVERLREAGFDAYLVGGCVRDMLLGVEPHDYDIATSALPHEVRVLFPHVLEVGAQFGVTKVRTDEHWFEVAAFRSDLSYSDGRRPDEVVFTDARGDVQRRDFTINGLLYDPLSEHVIDYVGGEDDLHRKLVRCIGSPVMRFTEDKLRMLRAVRFAARLDYTIESETFDAIKELAHDINIVSAERIGAEILAIVTGPHADRALVLLRDTGLLRHVLPEVQNMVGVEQPKEFHPEGDVFEHTRLMLGRMHEPPPALALGVLLHDVGKPPTFAQADRIRFNDHARVGAEMTDHICRRLRLPNTVTDAVIALVATHMRFLDVQDMRESRLKRFLREPYFAAALELHRLDCEASHGHLENWRFCQQKLAALEPEQIRPALLLTGDDLIAMGYQPGPRFRAILEAIEDAQLENVVQTREDAVELVRRNFPLMREERR